jgi:anti-sigma factor RsiW
MSATRPFITCEELIEFIGDYFDRSLSDGQSIDFDRHLAICEACRAYLATYEMSMRAAQTVMQRSDGRQDEAPEDLIRAVLEFRRRIR